MDADALLQAGRWSGAYYLIGYAVECALKACIAKQVNQFDFPDKTFATKVFTHNPLDLRRIANLEAEFIADCKVPGNEPLGQNWEEVKNWTSDSRYQEKVEHEARLLFEAVTDPTHGVLPWIQLRW